MQSDGYSLLSTQSITEHISEQIRALLGSPLEPIITLNDGDSKAGAIAKHPLEVATVRQLGPEWSAIFTPPTRNMTHSSKDQAI
jgi:hypothetical protein